MATKRKRAKRAQPKKRTKKQTKARAIWKGVLTFGSVTVPVKLYSAVQDRTVHFRLLDEKKQEPVEQHMIDPESGDVVEHEDVRRAIQVGKNKLVIVEDDELERLEPKKSRDIDITRFVPSEKIAHAWYDRPYWLGPDGEAKKYFALVDALDEQGRAGVARWVMRNKEYAGALRVENGYLMLITLRHASEVIAPSALEPPAGREPAKKELEMARQLVETMFGDFDIAAYKDQYRERVQELVEAKASGKVLRFPKAKAKKTDTDLEAVLARSLKRASA